MSEFNRDPMAEIVFHMSGLDPRPTRVQECHVKWYIGILLGHEPSPEVLNDRMESLWTFLSSAKHVGFTDQDAIKASRFRLPSGAWDVSADAWEVVLSHVKNLPGEYIPETVGQTIDGVVARRIKNIGLRWSRGIAEALFGEALSPNEVLLFLLTQLAEVSPSLVAEALLGEWPPSRLMRELRKAATPSGVVVEAPVKPNDW